jgi:RNA polymerase sigma factor (sigma-70 family)
MTPDELAQLLDEKRPEMIRVAESRLRRHGLEYEAEDFVQDAFLKLLNYRHQMTVPEAGAFIHMTVVHLIRDHLAKEQTKERATDEYTRVYQPDSQGQIRQRERLKLDVSLALDKLDAPTARIVQLVWMEGYNYRQVMKMLKITDRTITESLAAALPILQKVLGHYCPTIIPPRVALPYLYTPQERKAVAASIRKDRNARRSGPVKVTRYSPNGEEILSVTTQTAAEWRRTHRLTSRDSYKKENRETPDSTALQAAMPGDVHDETEVLAA